MTDPRDPGDDWGFPEVDPGIDPASIDLPSDDLVDEAGEPVYDTGSDAWWRQQAEAQRRAAAAEPVVPPSAPVVPEPVAPPELVEPEVLNQPSPLDEAWVPPELPELHPPAPEPEPVAEPVAEAVAGDPSEEVAWDDAPHDEDAWDDSTTAYPAEDPEFTEAEDLEPEPDAAPAPEQGPDWFRGLVEPGAAAVAEPMPEDVPPAVDDESRTRPPYEAEKVGPARALAGAGLALAGVVLAIGAIFVLNDKGEPSGAGPVVSSPTAQATTAAPSATVSPTPTESPDTVVTTPPPVADGPIVPVRVLNNSRIKGLAETAKRTFVAGGWPVPQTGNYRGGTLAVTTVYYPPGQLASAQRFAKQFGITRVAPRFAGIPVPGMTVILTRDYRA